MLHIDQSKEMYSRGSAGFTISGASSGLGEFGLKKVKYDKAGTIVILERNAFLRDCLLYTLARHWQGEVFAYASFSELARVHCDRVSTVALLSAISLSDDEAEAELGLLTKLDPPLRSMVLAKADDPNGALTALGQGAGGYISISAGFEILIEAIRFVDAGGIYVPPQCLLMARKKLGAECEPAPRNGISHSERKVIKAVRQGKSNKVIAHELNICESTVKVHLRNIMKKLDARNRTDVAMKGAELVLEAESEETGVAALDPGRGVHAGERQRIPHQPCQSGVRKSAHSPPVVVDGVGQRRYRSN